MKHNKISHSILAEHLCYVINECSMALLMGKQAKINNNNNLWYVQ